MYMFVTVLSVIIAQAAHAVAWSLKCCCWVLFYFGNMTHMTWRSQLTYSCPNHLRCMTAIMSYT